ncbi:MAG: alpha-amylase family glycosyl hydrolase [Candidatus Cryptobacteroides sp.]|jgi:glycosidase|nr:alpha-amylase family glycosyl hydrolase [Bacteroides sp.]MDD6624104.1 alpha-amylase family glycosyl hydrolase [Bacteroides sp.]MDY5302302.1 alpha-amylase family glycosyl hydrolase [Candidatus Cryptobacteroides sp.]MDY5407180.1 alpha-amylase family glycosyl hydrolase [Candidatus Cryptobacteroides sp.]
MGKVIIYQMLPRLWGNIGGKNIKNGTLKDNGCGKFSSIDTISLEYLRSLGVSHVWYTGIIRHATAEDSDGCTPSSADWVKGRAGSPYSITDYYDVNPYLADEPENRMEEFHKLVERTHAAGLKVIIDFVPNHVARDYGRFAAAHPAPTGMAALGESDDKSVHWKDSNDFFYYPGIPLALPIQNQTYMEMPAMASGNSYTSSPGVNDWYDTIKLNYCDSHTETWEKMYDIVNFWAGQGVDGFRCDMVELVPQAFFKWLISRIKKDRPNLLFVAEVYQKTLYSKYIREIGFDLLYDKSGIYDTLRAIVEKNAKDSGVPVEDWQSAKRITWNWQSLGDLQPYMLNFLENHDEQRFASDFFGCDARNSYAALYTALYMNNAPFMLYAGEEVGERGMDNEGFSGRDGRTSIFDWWAPSSLTRLYKYIHGEKKALTPEEETMLDTYRKALKFAAEDNAVSKGTFYDLCYCNYASDGFNPDRHFAFLRDFEDETLLIVCNFSKNDADMKISIPEHAFNWMKMPESEEFNHTTPVSVHVPATNGVIIKLFQ